MRWIVATSIVPLSAAPGLANTIVTVPFAAQPGTVRVYTSGDADLIDLTGLSLPFTQEIVPDASSPFCGPGSISVSVEPVASGLEVEIAGSFDSAGGGCFLGASSQMDGSVQSPELGGTTTAVMLLPEVVSSNIVEGTSEDRRPRAVCGALASDRRGDPDPARAAPRAGRLIGIRSGARAGALVSPWGPAARVRAS